MTATEATRRAARARFELPLFMVSSGLYQAGRLGVNLVAAAALAPAVFGTWNIVVVLQTYTTHATIGLLSGANRRVPLLLGRGAEREAAEVERAAYGGSLVAGGVLAVGAAAIGLIFGGPWQTAGFAVGLAVAAQQLYLFGQVLLRGNLQFNRASVLQLILALGFPVIGTSAVLLFGIEGLIATQGVAYAVGFGIVLAWRPDLRPRLDPALFRSLIREGAPIMLAGLAFALMTSVDRWAIVTAGTGEQLGQYALASTISASMMFVNLVVAQQLYPRMAHAYGAMGEISAVRRIAHQQCLVAGGLVLVMAVILAVGAPILVPTHLPGYASSVGAIQVLGIAYTVLAFSSGYTNLLVTIGAAWRLLAIQAITAAVAGALALAALGAGLGLSGVAGAMLTGYVGLGLTAALVGFRSTGAGHEYLR